MDADTRHHLKQNELLEALRKMKTLGDARTRRTLLFVVLIVLAVASYYLWQSRRDSSSAQGWQQLSTIVLQGTADAAALDQLRGLIAEQSDPGLVAMARLKLANGLIESATADEAEREAQLRDAVEILKLTADAPDVPATVAAAAWFAKASAYESLREFENARASYGKLSEDARFEGQPYRDLAATRLESLQDITVQIQFAPGEKPPPPPPLLAAPPTTQPASTPAASNPTTPATDSGVEPTAAPSEDKDAAGETDSADKPPASQPTRDPGAPGTP